MGTIYATTPLRSPPVPPITPVHRSSIDRTSQWPGSPTYENTTMTLTVSWQYNNVASFRVHCKSLTS